MVKLGVPKMARLTAEESARVDIFVNDPLPPIKAAIARQAKYMVVGYVVSMAVTLYMAVAAACNSMPLSSAVKFNTFVVAALGLAMVAGSIRVCHLIWCEARSIQRVSLVVAPIATFAVVWFGQDALLYVPNTLAGLLYGNSAMVASMTPALGIFLTALLQSAVLTLLLWLPLMMLHGLSINKITFHGTRVHDASGPIGRTPAFVYHVVVAYGAGLVVWAMWLPFFALPFT